jgi:hypothetical protein
MDFNDVAQQTLPHKLVHPLIKEILDSETPNYCADGVLTVLLWSMNIEHTTWYCTVVPVAPRKRQLYSVLLSTGTW